MNLIRSVVFQVAFYLLTALFAVLYLPFFVLPRSWLIRAGRFWCRLVAGLLAGIVGLRYRTVGTENIPVGPVVFAMKHQSAWETLTLPLFLKDPAVILKRELEWIPFFGWYLARHRMIAIDRSAGASALRQVVAQARERLSEGRSVVMFPEGTRTAPGAPPDYQPGIAALYAGVEAPVVPVALDSGLFWARREFAKRPGRITVSFLRPIEPGLPRREFMQRLQDAIEAESDRLVADSIK